MIFILSSYILIPSNCTWQSIPFENFTLRHPRLQALHGSQVLIDTTSLYDKLVTKHRGGCCYEMNGLMASVLQTCGFKLKPGAARVVREKAASAVGDRDDERAIDLLGHGHMILFVQVEDGSWWLEDVGFGGRCPEQPLPMVPYHAATAQGARQSSEHGSDTHRLRRGVPGSTAIPAEQMQITDPYCCGWYLQAKTSRGFEDQYFFLEEERPLADYDSMNWYVSTHPDSFFRSNTLSAIQTPEGRVTLSNITLTVHSSDGVAQTELKADSELDSALTKYFGICF
ncbi:hypothetical protein WJX72_009419 [[Myrmecia] bisecta]|uniref:Arylamine N-acetyltransferase n=1 Tax=[Myrmecia] bisecta TaxID=41462 RepID=A0AAW1PGT5_9CHLO